MFSFLHSQEINVIPMNLFTHWHSSSLPPLMKENYERMKQKFPSFHSVLLTDDVCQDILQTHFESNAIEAYNQLIPDSYKSDMCRYAALYVYGGIYYDIKFYTEDPFSFTEVLDQEYFVRDRWDMPSFILVLLFASPKTKS
jgi:mannosyltransferase OCH1-like enzyme